MFFALSNSSRLILYQLRFLSTSFHLILYLRRFRNFLKFNIFLIIHFSLPLTMITLKKEFFYLNNELITARLNNLKWKTL